MTRLPGRFILLSLSILLLSLSACGKKDTIINGRITDAKTGMPIKGVSINYGVWDGGQATGSDQQFTDIDGKFTIEIGYSENFSGLMLTKAGYVPKQGFGMTYKNGVVNNLDIKMHPKDGTLMLIVENVSGQQDSVFVGIYSPLQNVEYQISEGIINYAEFFLQGMPQQSLVFNLSSEETIDIFWNFSPMISNSSIKQAPFHDSVYVSRNDTTIFSITF